MPACREKEMAGRVSTVRKQFVVKTKNSTAKTEERRVEAVCDFIQILAGSHKVVVATAISSPLSNSSASVDTKPINMFISSFSISTLIASHIMVYTTAICHRDAQRDRESTKYRYYRYAFPS